MTPSLSVSFPLQMKIGNIVCPEFMMLVRVCLIPAYILIGPNHTTAVPFISSSTLLISALILYPRSEGSQGYMVPLTPRSSLDCPFFTFHHLTLAGSASFFAFDLNEITDRFELVSASEAEGCCYTVKL